MKASDKHIGGHLEDLARILIRIGIVVLISSVLVFVFTPNLFQFILNQTVYNYSFKLITIRPAEILMVQIKLAFWGGLILSSPVTIPLLWSYLAPALTKKEKKALTAALLPCLALFLAGFVFAHAIIAPLTTNFLYHLSQQFGIAPNWTVSAYISLILTLGLSFGLAFELPVVIFVLAWLGLVTPKGLASYRKHIVIILLISSALLTPPDLVSQILLTVPLYLLYEGSLLILKLMLNKDSI